MGPEYALAPKRNVIEGVPHGRVQQFSIDSKETEICNPGIAREKFGTVDPKNPKTLIVGTHEIDYKRQVTVYIPAQHKPGSQLPFRVVHDGTQGKPNMTMPPSFGDFRFGQLSSMSVSQSAHSEPTSMSRLGWLSEWHASIM